MPREDRREYLYRTFFRWTAVAVVLSLVVIAICAVLSVGSYVRLAVILLLVFCTFALRMIVAARHQN